LKEDEDQNVDCDEQVINDGRSRAVGIIVTYRKDHMLLLPSYQKMCPLPMPLKKHRTRGAKSKKTFREDYPMGRLKTIPAHQLIHV
jgi:hypothetical protein